MAGWQELFWNNELVSQKPASANTNGETVHEFDINVALPQEQTDQETPQRTSQLNSRQASQKAPKPVSEATPQKVHGKIQVTLQWQPFEVHYQLYVDGQMLEDGKRCCKDIERLAPLEVPRPKKRLTLKGLTNLVVRLYKNPTTIKLALACTSLMIYTSLFSFKFAAALLISLMFHEYGHIQAMKYFGLKTRGIYLLPFFTGFALCDKKVSTRWQSMVIALTGPSFGLLMSVFYMLIYGLTADVFFAALAVFNALINLFSLLPVLPLNGGHMLKNICFSMNTKMAIAVCGAVCLSAIVVSFQFELGLIALLLMIGSIEIAFQWPQRHNPQVQPLDRYAQVFSAVWYSVLVAAFIGVIWFFAGMGDDMLGLPLKILQS